MDLISTEYFPQDYGGERNKSRKQGNCGMDVGEGTLSSLKQHMEPIGFSQTIMPRVSILDRIPGPKKEMRLICKDQKWKP